MAPTPQQIEWQTTEIIKCLLDDDDDDVDVRSRRFGGGLETDGPDDFDPVLIADKLKTVADALNEDAEFNAALAELKKAAAQDAVEAACSHAVQALRQTQVSQRAEVAPEMQLIDAAVAFVLHVKKSCPELKNKVHGAMSAFINKHAGPWIHQQGGWDKVTNI
ncbi:hypothetical protein PAMP_017158 [Pampus punctatissimus]